MGRCKEVWIWSRELDLLAFTVPTVGSLIATPLLSAYVDETKVPLWGWLVCVALTDVGHVWSTNLRTYMDSEELFRRPYLYFISPVLIFVISFGLLLFNHLVFWTLLGYVARYHFVKQFYGFVALYKARNGERWDWTLDKYVAYAAAIIPMAIWHTEQDRETDWFGTKNIGWLELPEWPRPYLYVAWAAVALGYTFRQIQLYRAYVFNTGKNILMACCFITWGYGLLTSHTLIGLFFINFIHSFPSFIIMFQCCNNKWKDAEATVWTDKITKWLTTSGNWPYYLLALFGVGLLEELLWDYFVWQDYLPDFIDVDVELDPIPLAVVSALLTLPQSVHYWLDTFIWKMGPGQNPGLKQHLGLAPKEE